MSGVPPNPKIYHITHINNLAGIISIGGLVSDARRVSQQMDSLVVGMSTIKQRRLQSVSVRCHPGTTVGQYVPFYFCPRSIMLYILHRGNHPELTYRGGQTPIVHLQADFGAVVAWADQNGVPWAFSDRNAGIYLSNFYNSQSDLSEIDWQAVRSTDFRDPQVKEGKQAEFLLFDFFPWTLVEKVATIHSAIANQVRSIMENQAHRPTIEVRPTWYF